MKITSAQNPRIKAAAKLRDARQRQKQNRTLIDGARELRRALKAGFPLVEIYFDPSSCQSEDAQAVLEFREQSSCQWMEVPTAIMEKITFGQRAEGVVGVAEIPSLRLADLQVSPDALVAVVEGIEKPGNLGAVLRSADGAGVEAIIVADPCTDAYNPNAIRASLGTIFHVPLAVASTSETLQWLNDQEFHVLAARVDGAVDYAAVEYQGRTAIALGSEADGLSAAWQGSDIQGVQIPMKGIADSLNVSATAVVLFYEAVRQRKPVR